MIISIRKYIAVIALCFATYTCLHAQSNLEITFESSHGLSYLIEGCSDNMDLITFKLNQPASQEVKVATAISGSATNNMDFVMALPDTLVFAPGTDSLGFFVVTLDDNVQEGTETLIVDAVGDGFTSQIGIDIRESLDISFADGSTLELCRNGSSYVINTDGPTGMTWNSSLNLQVSDNQQSATILTPAEGTIQVIGMVGSCVDTSTLNVVLIDPTLSLNIDGDTDLCTGETALLTAVVNENNYRSIEWDGSGEQSADGLSFITRPNEDYTYSVKTEYANCSLTESVDIRYDEYYFPTVLITDTICQNMPTQFTSTVNLSTTNYDWTPGTYLTDSAHPFPYIIATDTFTPLTYKLVAVSERGFCEDSLEHIINEILPAEMEIDARDTVYLCLGDSTTLTAITSENVDSITWTSSHSELDTMRGEEVHTKPEVSTTIIATQYFINACILYDTVFVRVDSLPDNTILADPGPRQPCNKYCVGDTVRLYTDSIDFKKYPDITFYWEPDVENDSFDNRNFDFYIIASSTQFYFRNDTQNACIQKGEIFIEVEEPPTLSPETKTDVCYGESVTIQLNNVEGLKDIEWTANPSQAFNLDCMDCLTPKMRGIREEDGPVVMYTMTAKKGDCNCPVQTTVTFRVNEPNVTFSPSGTEHLVGSDTTIRVFVNPEVDADKVQWTYEGNVLNPPVFGFENMVNVPKLGENNYGVIVTTTTTTDEECVYSFGNVLIGVPPPAPYIPNVFSPNGDDMNDFFAPLVKAKGEPIPAASIKDFKIFSRWGQVVYDNETNATGWDGKIDGDAAPADVYVYLLEVISGSTSTLYKGDVTLVR